MADLLSNGHAKSKAPWAERLASIWCRSRPEDNRDDMERRFEECVRQGYPGEELEAYLNYERRNRNEVFWKFEERLPPAPAGTCPSLKERVRELKQRKAGLGSSKTGSRRTR